PEPLVLALERLAPLVNSADRRGEVSDRPERAIPERLETGAERLLDLLGPLLCRVEGGFLRHPLGVRSLPARERIDDPGKLDRPGVGRSYPEVRSDADAFLLDLPLGSGDLRELFFQLAPAGVLDDRLARGETALLQLRQKC